MEAVKEASFSIAENEFVALVGESGSGKSTIAKLLVGLEQPSGGRILLNGDDLTDPSSRGGARRAASVQMVFQDPQSALNPRRRVASIITQAMEAGSRHASWEERLARTRELLAEVGLSVDFATRLPGQLSGGQRQRVNIARALCNIPKILIADEIVSGLDVSIQAQLLNLLARLRSELGFGMLFISHDLSVVRHLCSRVLVMYRGEIVEQGPIETVFSDPQHPHTRALLSRRCRRTIRSGVAGAQGRQRQGRIEIQAWRRLMTAAGNDVLAVEYDAYGGPEVLKLRRMPAPRPAHGEVLVEVRAASMNPVDWKVRSGMLQKFFPVSFPAITGRDGAGEVIDCGRRRRCVAGRQARVFPGAARSRHVVPKNRAAGVARSANSAEHVLRTGSLIAARGHQRLGRHGADRERQARNARFDSRRSRRRRQLGGTDRAPARRDGDRDMLESAMSILSARWARRRRFAYDKTAFEEHVRDVDVVFDVIGGDVHRRSYRVLKRGGMIVCSRGRAVRESRRAVRRQGGDRRRCSRTRLRWRK